MKYVQLKELRDLVVLVSSAAPMGLVQHFAVKTGHLYFVVGGNLSEAFLYFVKLNQPIEGKYIIFNTLSGEIRFSQNVRTDPGTSSIPIVEIVNQNLVPQEIVEMINSL